MAARRYLIRITEPFLKASLVKQILVALVIGITFGLIFPTAATSCAILGEIFVTGLKAVAPLLVFVLVVSAIANHDVNTPVNMKPILFLYIFGSFAAALVAVAATMFFAPELNLVTEGASANAPGGIGEVLRNLIFAVVDNPVNALARGNFVGILAWAAGLGLAMRYASDTSRQFMTDLAKGVEYVVRAVIHCAPIGIFGLVANTVATTGVESMVSYLSVLGVLMFSFVVVALVMNPLMVWACIRRNPYPLTIATLRESGVTAFFTRSSAANIPMNMAMCRRLKLDEGLYSVSIPLGATINMAGAAITITVLTLAAAHTLGIQVDFLSAVLLSSVAALCACGASGVPGGSLMLIPLACGLFGIDSGIAMQVVAVGFVIGVLQDSAETALNSSSDVLFTAAACLREERLQAERHKRTKITQ